MAASPDLRNALEKLELTLSTIEVTRRAFGNLLKSYITDYTKNTGRNYDSIAMSLNISKSAISNWTGARASFPSDSQILHDLAQTLNLSTPKQRLLFRSFVSSRMADEFYRYLDCMKTSKDPDKINRAIDDVMSFL